MLSVRKDLPAQVGWTIIASPFCAKQGAKPYNTLIRRYLGLCPQEVRRSLEG
ncbi:MAG: hypothetical protein U7123_19225 [Potamolinea sp.]